MSGFCKSGHILYQIIVYVHMKEVKNNFEVIH